jgi:uncharacterized protein YdeI (YjbR/CyaY-like superfamily)
MKTKNPNVDALLRKANKWQEEMNKLRMIVLPGRQRAYLLYFAGAKQSITRESRVQKHLKRILNGKGLDD